LARPALVAARAEQPRPGDQRGCNAQDLEREQRIVPREAESEPEQPPGVAQRAKHGQRRQPVCRATTPIVMLRQPTLPKPAAGMRLASSRCGGKRRMLSCRYL